jgi:hypothetical protein
VLCRTSTRHRLPIRCCLSVPLPELELYHRPHEEKIIMQLIHMIVKDPVLIHKDNYVVMLTALR